MCVIFYYKAKACNHYIGTRAANCGQVPEGQEVYCSNRENKDAVSVERHCSKCIMSLMTNPGPLDRPDPEQEASA